MRCIAWRGGIVVSSHVFWEVAIREVVMVFVHCCVVCCVIQLRYDDHLWSEAAAVSHGDVSVF